MADRCGIAGVHPPLSLFLEVGDTLAHDFGMK